MPDGKRRKLIMDEKLFDKANDTIKELDEMLTAAISKRGNDWITFSLRVLQHIEGYTIPQYGDAPNDEVESWTIEECLLAVKKYNARYGKNSREGQQELDFLKMAHFVQLAYDKYINNSTWGPEINTPIIKGEFK